MAVGKGLGDHTASDSCLGRIVAQRLTPAAGMMLRTSEGLMGAPHDKRPSPHSASSVERFGCPIEQPGGAIEEALVTDHGHGIAGDATPGGTTSIPIKNRFDLDGHRMLVILENF